MPQVPQLSRVSSRRKVATRKHSFAAVRLPGGGSRFDRRMPLMAAALFSLLSLPTYPDSSWLGLLPVVDSSTLEAIPATAPCGLPACQQALWLARQQVGF